MPRKAAKRKVVKIPSKAAKKKVVNSKCPAKKKKPAGKVRNKRRKTERV